MDKPSLQQSLEPRLMFDGAMIEAGLESDAGAELGAEAADFAAITPDAPEAMPMSAEAMDVFGAPSHDFAAIKSVVFIDKGVDDYQSLLNGVSLENADVHVLQTEKGAEEISAVLKDYQNLDAIHIVSHGESGQLLLGNEVVDETNVAQTASWGEALTDDGDILLYGCDVAEGDKGAAFIDALADNTGADVAASDDVTGHADLGGDWDLEVQNGDIEAEAAIGDALQANYLQVLDADSAVLDIVVNAGDDTTLTEADLLHQETYEYTLDNSDTFERGFYSEFGNIPSGVNVHYEIFDIDLSSGSGPFSATLNDASGQFAVFLYENDPADPSLNGFDPSNPLSGLVEDAYGYTNANAMSKALNSGASYQLVVSAVNHNETGEFSFELGNGYEVAREVTSVNNTGTGEASLDASGNVTYNQNGAFVDLQPGQTATDTFEYTVTDQYGHEQTMTVNVTVEGHEVSLDEDVIGTIDDAALLDAPDVFTYELDGTDQFERPFYDANGNSSSGVTVDYEVFDIDPTSGRSDDFSASIQSDSGNQFAILLYENGFDPANPTQGLVEDAYDIDGFNTLSKSLNPNSTYQIVIAGLSADDQGEFEFTLGNGYNIAREVTEVTSSSAGEATLNADGTVDYDQNGAFNHLSEGQTGQNTITYVTTDKYGHTLTQTLEVKITGVNDVVVAADDSATTLEGMTVSGNVLTNDVDAEGEALSATLDTGPAHGTVVLNSDGSFTYTHDGSENFSDSFTYEVTDASGNVDTATVELSITPVNDVPEAGADTVATNEDTAVVTQNLLANDFDLDGDSLTVSYYSQPAHGSVIYNGDGTFTYTPDSNYNGADTFTYKVADGQGGVSEANTVTIAVAAINDGPSVTDFTFIGDEGDAVTTENVLTAASDVDGDTLSVDSFTQAEHGQVSYNGDGTFTYTPDADFVGADKFTYTVSDGNGGLSTASIDFDIEAVIDDNPTDPNEQPVVASNAPTFDEDSFDNLLGLAAPTDVDNDSLTITVTGLPNSNIGEVSYANGTLVAVGDTLSADALAELRFDTKANQNGMAGAFTYTVADGEYTIGGASVITVEAINDAPTAANDPDIVTLQGAAVDIDVAANDHDIEGELDPTSITIVKAPQYGNIKVNAMGEVIYIPNPDYLGQDSFSYIICDSEGRESNEAEVKIRVEAANDERILGLLEVAEQRRVAGGGNSQMIESTAFEMPEVQYTNFVSPDSLVDLGASGGSGSGSVISLMDGVVPNQQGTLLAEGEAQETHTAEVVNLADKKAPTLAEVKERVLLAEVTPLPAELADKFSVTETAQQIFDDFS